MSKVSGKRRLGPALSTVAAIQMVSVMAIAPSAMAQETKDLIIPDPTQQIAFGAYDPPGTLSNDKDASIEHLFLPWEDVELESLFLADQYALERGRSVMITIEPWTWGDDWRLTGVKSEMCWIICLDAAPPRWVSRGRFVPRILRSVRL